MTTEQTTATSQPGEVRSSEGLGLDPKRAEFEKWFGPRIKLYRAAEGYSLMSANAAWKAWQDAWDMARERCAKVCEDNAPDSPTYFEIAERLRECAAEIRRA